ncbi:MAG TPA: cupin domain-containing protein [Balneolaceae bacterium]|nr:cupin domain-containing protein [Balneolaceae bacterium]
MDIQKIINHLNLSLHPEGGYYREIYRSTEKIQRENSQTRHAATGIYFLIPYGVCTDWHRVNSDELWHFYTGAPLVLEIIDADGNFSQLLLHDKLDTEAEFQGVVQKNCWQRAYSRGEYSLVGCTVAPGFEFEDFEMIEPERLAKRFSKIGAEIVRNPFS